MKKFSKILSIVLCLAMILGMAVMASAATPAIADGEYVIVCTAYNKALSSEKTGYYNVGVDVTVSGSTVSGYGDAEKWTVTNNGDGTISISQNGQNLALADSFSSMNLGEANDKWVLEDAGNGMVYVKNSVRGNYIEWYDGYSNWSTYGSINDATLFALTFIRVDGGSSDSGNSGSDNTGSDNTGSGSTGTTDPGYIEYTVDTLGLESQAYTSTTGTVSGVGVEWVQLGNYGNGIQMRDKDGKTSMFWNTEAMPANITKIEFTYSSSKSVYSDNNMIVNFGTEAKGADDAQVLVTDENATSYVITPNGDYEYFYIEWDTGYSSYWDSIKVYYEVETGNTDSGNSGEQNQPTGDMSIAGLVVALTAAAGCAVVLTKKKEF